MKNLKYYSCLTIILISSSIAGFAQASGRPDAPKFDADLAQKLGADDYGMKNYVFCILKTGPNDLNYKGKERDDIFAAHLANIGRLSDLGKLGLAGPFGKNDKNYRGLFIFNVSTVEEAQKLVNTDPAIKAGILVPEFTLWYGSAALMEIPELHKKLQKKSL